VGEAEGGKFKYIQRKRKGGKRARRRNREKIKRGKKVTASISDHNS